MCGIFGVITRAEAKIDSRFCKSALEWLAVLSIERGRDSSGVVFRNAEQRRYDIVKGDLPISELFKSREYKELLSAALSRTKRGETFQAMGHSRLVTNGSQLQPENNQPVVKNSIIGIHNGIIVNDDQLWLSNPDIKREYKIDTEVMLALLTKELNNGVPLSESMARTMNQVDGTVSTALFFQDLREIVLATNNGSLYYVASADYLLFASEKFFLEVLIKRLGIADAVRQLQAFSYLILDPSTFKKRVFNQKENGAMTQAAAKIPFYPVNVANLKSQSNVEKVIDPASYIDRTKEKHLIDLLEFNARAVSRLRRCTKCILPETFPFIEFDSNGECNYCKNYRPKAVSHSREDLKQLVAKYKRSDGKPDCIVPFSGGRDSTYSLHVIRNELGLNPIAYTYDWGMVTDLARRNIARVCGKLGVENIVVAADIHQKRTFIRKNVIAWLRKPHLGMIPLFMSGDKAFHYYLIRLQRQTGISLNIWGENALEKTDFKVGFAGVTPEFQKAKIYSLSKANVFKLMAFLGKSVINNPAYINESILDNLRGQYSRSFQRKTDYYNFYDFYPWDEDVVNSTIRSEYDWEGAIDTESTWRVGDGTSAFYNYIYYTVAGFSEFDTFRSNQIREGMIDRDSALTMAETENQPRYETLRWYLAILQLDFAEVIKRINLIPKLYNANAD